MKKLLVIFTVLMVISSSLYARASKGGSISVTSTAQAISIEGQNLYMKNNGTDEVYIELEVNGSSSGTVTTSDFELKSGEEIYLSTAGSFSILRIVCDTTETATVRYISYE